MKRPGRAFLRVESRSGPRGGRVTVAVSTSERRTSNGGAADQDACSVAARKGLGKTTQSVSRPIPAVFHRFDRLKRLSRATNAPPTVRHPLDITAQAHPHHFARTSGATDSPLFVRVRLHRPDRFFGLLLIRAAGCRRNPVIAVNPSPQVNQAATLRTKRKARRRLERNELEGSTANRTPHHHHPTSDPWSSRQPRADG